MKLCEALKLVGAVALALLVAVVASVVADAAVAPKPLAKNAYVVTVAAETPAAVAAPSAAKAVAEATPADKGPSPIAPLLAAASVEAGQKTARACAACHDFTKGGPNKVGPNLYNIVNNARAHSEGFAYSDGMKALRDKKWTYEDLNLFLYNPRNAVKGTKMAFAGLKNDADRANVIAWLRTLSDQPAALPEK